MADIKRIGVGNSKYTSVGRSEIIIDSSVFTFDSDQVLMDSTVRNFDEHFNATGDYSITEYSNTDYSV